MVVTSSLQIIKFQDLERWDVKYFAGRIDSKYPLVSLSEFVEEHNEKVRPFDHPKEIYKILGVNNTDGIFHAYDAKGKEINQPYKKVSAGDFAYNPYRINVGSIGWVPYELDGEYISPAYVVFSVDKKVVLPELLWFILKADFYNKSLRAATAGSVRMNLTYPLLKTLKVPIPPLPVQRKIVDYWQEARQAVDNAKKKQSDLVDELHNYLVSLTPGYSRLRNSRMFIADFSRARQWDAKAGRAAAFRSANPSFVRLGNYTEECTELVRPWNDKDKEWPVYGVNNKEGVFLSVCQLGKDFNAPYKRIEKNWFFHNPTRANVGSLGIVSEVPEDAITSPEYQVWRLTSGFLPGFMALMLQTEYFLTLVSFNRVGGVKQRMYYANLAEIRLPMIEEDKQKKFADTRKDVLQEIVDTQSQLQRQKQAVEEMILGIRPVEEIQKHF